MGGQRWLCLGALALLACDPVLDARREALGPEAPGVRKGPMHRPGQPCLVCHRDGGEGPTFTVAGTVFRDPAGLVPVQDATVVLIDAMHEHITATTNCVGNFYLTPRDASPTLPMWTTVELGTISTDMESALHLDGDCGSCHGDPVTQAQAGHVFVTDDPALIPTVPMATRSRCD